MDRETLRKMAEIHKSIPKELTKGMVRETRDDSTLESVENATRGIRLTKDQDRKISEMRESGAFSSVSKSVDESKTKKIDAYLKGKIEAEIHAGRLKRPTQDGWMRKMQGNHRGGR